MDKQKLLELAGQLVLAGLTKNDGEIEKISEELAAATRHPQTENGGETYTTSLPLEIDTVGFLKFTNKEILKMPDSFKKIFRADGFTVHVRKRKRSKSGYHYEARYRRDGFNISVSSTDYTQLKPKFIESLHKVDKRGNFPKVPTTFNEFTLYYFENFRKRKVSKVTYAADLRRYRVHLLPYFGSMPLRDILPAQCQKIIDELVDAGQTKTAEETFSLMNVIFKMAIAHNVMPHNPLAIVYREAHERQHGKALTKEEEKKLLDATASTPYQLMFAVALYTGLRPNEYKTARIEGKFIVAVNSKRKTKKTEYKKIPITPMLRPYLDGVTELKFFIIECIRYKFKDILPEHRLYDLRTTFYTRCHECGVADVARMEFVGHSLGKLGNAYTDLSDEYLLKEGEKLNY